MSVAEDVNNTIKMIKRGPIDLKYWKVYKESNEDIDAIYNGVDLSNRDVLTVLGSGDQAFYAYLKDARKVDLFDVNKLTFYYFYLRIWNIRKTGNFYLDYNLTNDKIYKLIRNLKTNSTGEDNAYHFWYDLISNINDSEIDKMFFCNMSTMKIDKKSIKKLRERLNDDNYNFYNVDISKNINIDDSYHYVVTSNISDWLAASFDINSLDDNFKKYMNNLYNLLKRDGMVLSSNLCDYDNIPVELPLFSEKFDYDKIYDCRKEKKLVGHKFIKKV